MIKFMKITQKKIVIIGSVWPEPNSSAAGWRMMELIYFFQFKNYQITFACSASDSQFSFPIEDINIEKVSIELNNDSFNDFITELNPNIVLFDRFMTEEQFGWRVAENCPNAIRILDTEDLHCLRYARQSAFKEKKDFQLVDLNSEIAKREIASIFRCDLSLIISEFELDILKNHFKVDTSILLYLPFMLNEIDEEKSNQWKKYSERSHIVFIGNFYHEPNWNSVLFLKEDIWPKLSKKLPGVQLHIYGAYPTQKVQNLNNPKEQFYCFGRAKSAEEVISSAKLLLAPIRFGAGLKGKLAEAMIHGTPSITTSIGAEGMNGVLEWNGIIANSISELINSTADLYQNETYWKKAQLNGIEIINKRFNKNDLREKLDRKIDEINSALKSHRNSNFVGQMLLHHSQTSTKYLSKWIMEKNKKSN